MTRYCCSLDPFFHQNVGGSAWGLALHTTARLIAVSANTHDISIFAFALREPSSSEPITPSDDDDEETLDSLAADLSGTDWVERRDLSTPPDRSHSNELIVLRGHSTNIPNIAFFDSPLYHEGDILVSTDIAGVVTLWSIWSNKMVASYPLHGTSYAVAFERYVNLILGKE